MTLRVFHLTTDSEFLAGAEHVMLGIARAADRARWDLEFCTLTRGPATSAFAGLGWPVHSLGMRVASDLPLGLVRLRRLLSVFRPDVLHTHLSHASILAAIAAVIDRRFALIQTRHYSDYVARFRKRRLFADSWAARRCDRIVAVSEAARTYLVEHERVSPAKVTVVENGVDWDGLATLDRVEGRRRLSALGIPPGPTIGCAATFDIRKGHTYLLQAMVRVFARFPQAQLVLLGTGVDEMPARTEASALGISAQVHFLGHRADAHQLMSGLDVYVQPSIEEGFGLAVIEAMAMRLPVVVSAVGGMLKTVEPDRSGLRVAPADPKMLAGAILAVLEDPARARLLGARGSERVRTNYSLHSMLAKYDDVYQNTLRHRDAR